MTDIELWSLDRIARFAECSKDTARRMMALPNAPRAIRVQAKKISSHPRYVSAEVVEWFNSQKEKA